MLVEVALGDAEPLSRSLDLIHPRPRPLSVEALAFLQALRAAVKKVAVPTGSRRARRAS